MISRALQIVGALVMSAPPYWLGFLVLVWFAPGTGYVLEIPFVSGLMDFDDAEYGLLGWVKALWMPWVLVGLPLAAAVMRMVVLTLRDAAGEEYLRTARAKGLSDRRVLYRHELPLAVAPVAALTAATMPLLVTNVALMESAFNIPGLYREIRSVYSNADLPLIQAMVIETTILIVVANTLADLIQARLDPRVR
jgi:peptide/nickel transport system permease protein